MKNRMELADMFRMSGFTIGAEIGVCNGYYSRTLLERIPGLFLIGVDNWSDEAKSHSSRNKDDKAYETMLMTLAPWIESGQYRIIRKPSMDALADIEDGSLDFVYIDAGHTYAEVKEDIEGWEKKVRKGGILAGHDYYEFKSGRGGVIPAVNEFVLQHGYDLNVTDWDHGNPDRDSRQPSWYFVKEV